MKQIVALNWFLSGSSCLIFGIFLSIWTLYDIAMEERLEMRPGFPSFDWWYNLPDVVRMKCYFFNITNEERFLNGSDAKLKLAEVGPIVFREIWHQSDVVFNDNGTMSYTVRRTPVWDRSLNNIDLNATLVVPNLPVLMTASMFWDSNFFVKTTLNYVFKKTKSRTIVKKTVYEMLYNNTDTLLDIANSILPSIATTKNGGVLNMMYNRPSDRITAFMGRKSGHQRFSLLDKINGTNHIPGRGATCKDNITDATELSLYSQLVSKDRVIKYYRNIICRTVPLVYKEDVYKMGIKTYLFVPETNSYDRTQPPYDDCYKDDPALPDGITDMSPCAHNFPLVGSFPHFLYGDPKLRDYVDGLKPNITRHSSHLHIEPVTGLNFGSEAIMQSNIHMRPLKGFHEMFDKFSDTIIPVFYISIGNGDLPGYLVNFVKVIHLLPIIGGILNAVLLLFGSFCLWKFLNRNIIHHRKMSSHRHIRATKPLFSAEMEKVMKMNLAEMDQITNKSETSNQNCQG